MELFTKILEMLTRDDLKNPEKLVNIYREIIKEYIENDETHLISYLNIRNIVADSWFKLPESQGSILFYTDKFSHKTVYEDWARYREYIEIKKIRTFRHYVYEKGERKYPILLLTRQDFGEELIYPELKKILFQVATNKEGAEKLADILELFDPADRAGLTKVFLRRKRHFSDWKYTYYYVTPIKRKSAVTGVSIFTADTIRQDKLLQIVQLLDLISAHVDLDLTQTLLTNFSLRSAIAAIMSRNMSHNVGSHVLARIASRGVMEQTQNKGVSEILNMIYKDKVSGRTLAKELIFWSKDAQLLAQYVQQRMDFIAQVSSEWPTWTEPAYLLKNVMRGFLYQKHLLNFIAASEELGAHLFHERRHKENLQQYEGDIRLHIFLVPEELWAEPTAFLHLREETDISPVEGRLNDILACRPRIYTEYNGPDAQNPWNHILLYTPEEGEPLGETTRDILLAIPGGVVGYHAFYVILENIIRNAAKHGFVKTFKDHLDIVIEICYTPRERINIPTANGRLVPAWLVRIYDNVSFVRKKYGSSGVDLWGERDGEKGINDRLGLSVIQGGVKKEDWGLAEMKIAAGYLQQRSLEHIGKLQEEITGRKVTELPRGTLDTEMFRQENRDGKGGSVIIRAVESPIGTLGYEFYVLRPKTVGIIEPGGDNHV